MAPVSLQHEIKDISHSILADMVQKMKKVDLSELKGMPKVIFLIVVMYVLAYKNSDSTNAGLLRELLLIIQWMNFFHNAGDFKLLFSDDMYAKLTAVSSTVNTRVKSCVVSDTVLLTKLQTCCTQMMRVIALTAG